MDFISVSAVDAVSRFVLCVHANPLGTSDGRIGWFSVSLSAVVASALCDRRLKRMYNRDGWPIPGQPSDHWSNAERQKE